MRGQPNTNMPSPDRRVAVTGRLWAGLAVVAALAVGAGCGESDSASSSSDEGASVVATTTQVGDLVRQVGRGRVEVTQLLRPGTDPHSYEPRPSDAVALAETDVVFRSGGDLDEWLGDLIESAGGDAETVELSDALRTRSDDPHWWQDPRNAVRAVGAIARALADADPEGRRRYAANARAYARRLRRLDRAVAACIDRIPPAKRKLVTTHDALGYYADRYGLTVVGALIPSLSTAAQPSAGDVRELVEQIEREGVEAIFPESSLEPRLERAVAGETGAEVGGALWADALGPEGSSGATYVESIQSNTEAIVAGLTGGAERCRPRV
jgi:ABC-type Zn uptake system ZnuABC Zn-binding protein ZnuA